ncbi:hypothetical protein A3J19_01810 [Candidatus Daviesbacteria bacterium RIFCSPLOWO2_02_FULL_41_8]|nr:MAG: hypothetical protein A3J19_01810 [Candidatus Daviesbacteria bacterium RIFCSPLOWO2_02_FULL_41_8]
MKKLTGKSHFCGFTLIELLVVITIISILMAVGFTVYSFAVRQGRDSKRQSDMRAIQSALEQYYFDQGFYPCAAVCGASTLGLSGAISAASTDRTAFRAFTNAIGNPVAPTSSRTYMNALPFDPDP